MMVSLERRYNLLPVLLFIHELMRSQCIKHVINLASKFGQCSTMLFLLVLFMKSDIDKSGINQKQFHWPT